MATPYDDLYSAAAQKYGLETNWLTALGQIESSQNPNAVSPAGAQGLMQLMPATGRSVGVTNPFDPAQSIDGGANYFSQMLKLAGGNYPTAVMYYNCGPGNSCPAGRAEAGKVGMQAALGPSAGDIAGQTSPATPNYKPGDDTPLGGLLPKLGNIGIIVAGAILVILAMAIPNRKLVVQTVGAVAK